MHLDDAGLDGILHGVLERLGLRVARQGSGRDTVYSDGDGGDGGNIGGGTDGDNVGCDSADADGADGDGVMLMVLMVMG